MPHALHMRQSPRLYRAAGPFPRRDAVEQPAGGALAEGRRHAHDGAVAVAVERAVALDVARRVRGRNGLAAEDAVDADAPALARRAVELAQPLAQLGEQRVVRGVREVVDV